MMYKVRELRGATGGMGFLYAALAMALGQWVETSSGQCNYEVTAILEAPVSCGVLGPPNTFATAINDNGVVTGYYSCLSLRHPFMWSEEMGFVLIPLPPGVSDATPADINNYNEIVGTMNEFSDGPHAFHWKDGVWTELEPLPGLPQARANAINNKGTIVGQSVNILTGPALACMWSNGAVYQIEPLSNVDSVGRDLNESSSVVGRTSRGLQGSQRGFWWNDGISIEIPPLPKGTTSDAVAVNSRDMVVGTSVLPSKSGPNLRRSWVYQDGAMVDLGLLGGNPRLTAIDINDAAQAVGYSSNSSEGNQIPFLWQHDVIHDLRPLVIEAPQNLNFRSARGTNQRGQIIGSALLGSDTVAIVLTPVDQPLGDVNFDCTVDEHDLIAVLEDWGPDKAGHPTDMASSATFAPPGDGRVDAADLAIVLGNWSPRPQPRPSGGSATTSAR